MIGILATTKKLALAACLSLLALVSTIGCQSAQENAGAMTTTTPTATPAPTTTNPPTTATNPPPAPLPRTPVVTPPPAPAEWPKMVTLPAGTAMLVALQSRLRTDGNTAGDAFRANLVDAVRVNQMTVLPAGTEVRGQLTIVEEPHRTTGKAQMTLAFQELIDPSGDLRSIAVSPIVLVAEGDKISDEAKVASGAVIGGVIGALAGKKQRAKNAAIGAAAGAAAGGALALATKGKQLDLPAGQQFEFELDQSMTLPVTRLTAQLQGNSPTPNYAALHPTATAYNNTTKTTTAAEDRAAAALAQRQVDELAALNAQWPKVVTVPAGATLIMALQTHLRTDSNTTGDVFRAHLTEAVRVDQMTVFPIGSEVRGQLTFVEEPHRTSGKAQMTLSFDEIIDPAGLTHALVTTPVVLVGKGDKITDETKVGAGAVIGGIIGALASKKDKTKGAAVGAAAGAVAGGAIALAGKGEQIDLPTGQRFAVDLDQSMRVSVTRLTASK